MFLPLPSLLIAAIFMLSVALAVYALVPDTSGRVAAEALGLQGVDTHQVSPVVQALRPFFQLFVPLVRPLELARYREKVERKFVSAGMAGAMSTDEFLGYKLTMMFLFWGLFVGLFMKLLIHWHEPLVVDVLVVVLGFIFPDAWLDGEVRRRKEEIRRSLPYVMDLLTLSVEAGLDFVAGLYKVCEKARPGPLIEELQFFLREIQIGASRQQALRDLAFRCDMPEISSFSALLIQADILGASVGPVLRAQSDLIRTRRFQRAERKGAVAAQKILFPLILCIMPAVFIVIFGPIVLNFVYGSGVIGG